MRHVANARMYSVNPQAASAWKELFAWLSRESGLELDVIDQLTYHVFLPGVDFPQPEGPRMVTKSLLPTLRSVGSRARVGALPWRAGKVRDT